MILAAWNGHTAKSRALAACIDGARQALGWKHDELAQRMGLSSREELAHMLAGRKPLNLFRLADLGDDFDREYDKRRAALRGACVYEAPDLAVVRGFSAMDSRQMVKMTTPYPVLVADRKEA